MRAYCIGKFFDASPPLSLPRVNPLVGRFTSPIFISLAGLLALDIPTTSRPSLTRVMLGPHGFMFSSIALLNVSPTIG